VASPARRSCRHEHRAPNLHRLGRTSGDGPLHRWQEMHQENRERRLMEHALGRVRQDSLHRQRGRGTHLSFDELHKQGEARVRGSRLKSDRFLRHMALLLSFHEKSDGWREQKMLSRLKNRAKILVSNLSPGDEEVTQTVEWRTTKNSAVRHLVNKA
jgi:hypothetical protein